MNAMLETTFVDVTPFVAIAPATNNDMPWHNLNVVHIGGLAAGATFTGFQAPIVTETFPIDILAVGDAVAQAIRRELIILNRSGQTLTFNHQDTSSTTANRINTGSAASAVTVANGGVITLLYNPIEARWTILGVR